MNLLKLNTIVVSTVALVGVEAALAKSKPVVPNTANQLQMAKAASVVHTAMPLVKRSILVSVGQVNPSTGDISANLEADGYADPDVVDTSDATTFAIGVRQPIGKHWSADMTYIDQGEITANVEATPSGANPSQDVANTLPIYGSGINYAGLRHFRVMRGVTAHAGVGAFIYTSERQATIDGSTYTTKDGGVSPMGQLGLSFEITPRMNVELTAQRFFMSGEDVDRLSVGLSFGF